MPSGHLPINPFFASDPTTYYTNLKNEIQTNPSNLSDTVPGVGVETLVQMAQQGRYQDAANLLNKQGAVAGEVINTGILPVETFQAYIVAPELMALSETQRADLSNFLNEYKSLFGGIPLNDPGTWNSIVPSFFPSTAPLQTGYTSNTYQQLQSLRSRPASRAENLFNMVNLVITHEDVAQAINFT